MQFVEVKQLNTSYNIAVHETVNQIGLLFFYCSKLERRTENEKYRQKNLNGGRRNQAVTKQKKETHQSAETGRAKEKR